MRPVKDILAFLQSLAKYPEQVRVEIKPGLLLVMEIRANHADIIGLLAEKRSIQGMVGSLFKRKFLLKFIEG